MISVCITYDQADYDHHDMFNSMMIYKIVYDVTILVLNVY